MDNNINMHNKSSLDTNNNEKIYGQEALFMSKYRRLLFRNGLVFGIIK